MTDLSNLPNIVLAVGGLGTAAFGLVDASKALGGGVSKVGFKYIKDALDPFSSALSSAVGDNWTDVMFSHWINGKPKNEQKAIAKSMIRLGLTPVNATKLASAGGVDQQKLSDAAKALQAGTALTQDLMDTLGRMDASIDVRIDAAFERADQAYRNMSKTAAAVIAIALAVIGGASLSELPLSGFLFRSADFWQALLVGLLAVPLAPMAKDVSSALNTAASTMRLVKGRKP